MNGTIVGDGIPESYTAMIVEPNKADDGTMMIDMNYISTVWSPSSHAEAAILKYVRQFTIEDVEVPA